MTDKAFREWIQKQPSCISGNYSEFVNGEGRCVAAHVRRAGKSGIAFKEEYACIPMTQEEHQFQHQHGELSLLIINSILCPFSAQVHHAKEWFDKQVERYVAKWKKRKGTK